VDPSLSVQPQLYASERVESLAESSESLNHVQNQPGVPSLHKQELLSLPLTRTIDNSLQIVEAATVTTKNVEFFQETNTAKEDHPEQPILADLLSRIGNKAVREGEIKDVACEIVQPASSTSLSSAMNSSASTNLIGDSSSNMETLAVREDLIPDIEAGKVRNFVEHGTIVSAPERNYLKTTCRIRVRQDMFQDTKEEPISICPILESVQVMAKDREEEQEQVEDDSWAKEEDKQWLRRSMREEDVLETAGARSPPPRTLSRRLDYRRQRRHQWRSPFEGAPPSQRTLSGIAPVKDKSRGPELITLNLNTESLDPEPPGLLSDWQLTIQPLMTSSDQPAMTSSYLSHKLKLRQAEAMPVPSHLLRETAEVGDSQSSRLQQQGKRVISYGIVDLDCEKFAGSVVIMLDPDLAWIWKRENQ